MHAVGLHSALAIKRQRKRRNEQRRARERRYSSQSVESGLTSPRASTASLDQHLRPQRKINAQNYSSQTMVDSKVVTSIGMLHIGIVFLVLGAFLLVSGLLPSDFTSWRIINAQRKWWNELVGIGVFFITVGFFLVILNRAITKKEENDLEKYVQRQLTRSKSGHRLERDIETGALTTKNAKRVKLSKTDENPTIITNQSSKDSVSTYKCLPNTYLSLSTKKDNPMIKSSLFLEQITEEELISEKLETSTINSLTSE